MVAKGGMNKISNQKLKNSTNKKVPKRKGGLLTTKAMSIDASNSESHKAKMPFT